ncbi:MAG: hypothetical protein Q8S40_08185, partial [Falsiroseomonas sp.]|nr:hypothetical protein [Falsiroseomonas sp.]
RGCWSQQPNPTEDHRGGRPGRSASLSQGLRYAPRASVLLHHHPGHDRLKDWRRIAMRYDRCTHTFFSAITLAATVTFWLGQ